MYCEHCELVENIISNNQDHKILIVWDCNLNNFNSSNKSAHVINGIYPTASYCQFLFKFSKLKAVKQDKKQK